MISLQQYCQNHQPSWPALIQPSSLGQEREGGRQRRLKFCNNQIYQVIAIAKEQKGMPTATMDFQSIALCRAHAAEKSYNQISTMGSSALKYLCTVLILCIRNGHNSAEGYYQRWIASKPREFIF